MSKKIKELDEANADAISIVTPSKFEVTIRQQTGEDDDIISNPDGSYMGEALNEFVKGIVIKFGQAGEPATYEQIENMKLCDKYFIMVASRIFSLGPILRFEYEWPDGIVAPYEENLEDFVWDYSLEDFPKKGDEGYIPYRIAPHAHGQEPQHEFAIPSGKKFRFTFMNGVGEKYLMTLPVADLTKNAELKARNLEQKIGENWVVIDSFKNYTAREMVAIRKGVFDNDPIMEVISEIPHPKTKETIPYSLLSSSDFLFPREI